MATREELKALMEAQQKQFSDLLNALVSKNAAPVANNSELYAQINGQIPDFRYDPEADSTFALWFERFGDFVLKDGQSLSEDMKVRLILGKLSPTDYIRFEQQILPKKPTGLQFNEVIAQLKDLFSDIKSRFVRQFECFQLCCAPAQSVLDFGATVNAKCERADMSLSKEEIKCMIFISGLGDSHRDLRHECLRQMEKGRSATPPRTIKLETLLEECRAIQSLQSSSAALGNPGQVHAIQSRPQKLGDGRVKKPPQNTNFRQNLGTNFRQTAGTNFRQNSGKANGNKELEPRNDRQSDRPPRSDDRKCPRCGGRHFTSDCPYPAGVQCRHCGQAGHIRPVCPSRCSNFQSRMQSHAVVSTFSIVHPCREWIMVPLQVNGQFIQLAADSCSHLTILQQSVWESLGSPTFQKAGKLVGSFSGHKLRLLGSFECKVKFRDVELTLECSVTKTQAPSIMGLDWIVPFERATQLAIATTLPSRQAPTVHAILQPTDDPTELAEQMKNSFPSVFQPGLGHCTKTKATLHLKAQVKPVFCRARPVPHGVLDVVDKELDRLLEIGAIKPVDFSRWAAPVLAVRKKSGAVRICIDFSTGLNEALELNRHPLPRTEDIFHALRGSKIFSQLDLRDAYLQMELDESSKSLVGINTHRGLFAYQRLPFGVKSAPSIFQKVMDQMIAGLPGVFAYLDDVIIASNDLVEHTATLRKLFVKIQEYGFRIQMEKCHFLKKELRFLGHIVSVQGVRPDPARSAAIRDMPPPTDLSTLRSFLGALNYYGRFIKVMRELRGPLDVLLKKDTPWEWGEAQQAAFDKAKEVLQSDLLLTQYDPTKPIIVAADASQSGIGATISHKFADGTERVIEHACRALSPAERNYAQIEREALSLIFACQKFHRMIYGRKFTLLTDHKPLLAIFGNKKGIPIYTASRLQRWALILTNYDFTIQYVRSENFGQADVLSRLIASQKTDEEAVIAYTSSDQIDAADDVGEFVHLATLEPLPVDAAEVSDHTAADELLQQVVTYVRSGWPQKGLGTELMPYFSRRNTLSCVGGSLLTGTRVVIPRPLRQRVLKTLHFAHPGMNRMKALARQHVFWPGLDQEVEGIVRNCRECQLAAKLPTKAPLRPWPTPDGIFGRVHIDFAGPCWDGNTYLILVDALSKWPEIMQMNSTTAFSTAEALNQVFHRYGFPRELVSDNGPPFSSFEFATFCRQKGIKHTFSPPYQPHCNGQAERMVDTFKRQAKKNGHVKNQKWISEFLFAYRNTPSQVLNGFSPAELFLGRSLRSSLSLLKPSRPVNTEAHRQQYRQHMKRQYDRRHGATERQFQIGDSVLALSYGNRNRPSWLEGKIVGGKTLVWKVHIPLLGTTVTRHNNQLRRFTPCRSGVVPNVDRPDEQHSPRVLNEQHSPLAATPIRQRTPSPQPNVQTPPPAPRPPVPQDTPRPQRQRRPPVRFSPSQR